ncbi:hypothetical protein [Qipengyuania flava]|uniref:hypothetical protein n=1 Tax=Qipengyuania flava TaxID=192812 RepID=UPI0012FDD7FC|nr:hypothetical protein [Qipengyuania flava]
MDELDRICGYKNKPIHIVIIKEKRAWLESIANWALRCDWFSSWDDVLTNMPKLEADYSSYVSFWQKMEVANPDRVWVISFKSLMDNQLDLIEGLQARNLGAPKSAEVFRVSEVPMSPAVRNKQISMHQIDSYFEARSDNLM